MRWSRRGRGSGRRRCRGGGKGEEGKGKGKRGKWRRRGVSKRKGEEGRKDNSKEEEGRYIKHHQWTPATILMNRSDSIQYRAKATNNPRT